MVSTVSFSVEQLEKMIQTSKANEDEARTLNSHINNTLNSLKGAAMQGAAADAVVSGAEVIRQNCQVILDEFHSNTVELEKQKNTMVQHDSDAKSRISRIAESLT